jgi:hypothetical protein
MFITGLLLGLILGVLLTGVMFAIIEAHQKMVARKAAPPIKHRRRVRAGARP